ncbi:MAG: hypothetical protein JWO38_4840 [Gemmataceae bacterium]|nr:hypothetical protein [Gemmataceae bacterium]
MLYAAPFEFETPVLPAEERYPDTILGPEEIDIEVLDDWWLDLGYVHLPGVSAV